MNIKSLIILAFGTAIGITLVVFACALPQYNLWWPIFVSFFYILSVIPLLIVKRLMQNQQLQERPGFLDVSIFITTGLIVSSFGLPFVLWRAGVIRGGALVLTVGANFIVYLTMLGYFSIVDPDEDTFY